MPSAARTLDEPIIGSPARTAPAIRLTIEIGGYICRRYADPGENEIPVSSTGSITMGGGKRYGNGRVSQIFQIDLPIWKNFQVRAGSDSQFFLSIPERVVVDPEELRGLGFISARPVQGLAENLPVELIVRSSEIESFRGEKGTHEFFAGRQAKEKVILKWTAGLVT